MIMVDKLNMEINDGCDCKKVIVGYNGHSMLFKSLSEAGLATGIPRGVLGKLLNGSRGISSNQGVSVNYSDGGDVSNVSGESPTTNINRNTLRALEVLLAPKGTQRWGGPKPDPAGTIEITINELYTDRPPYQSTVGDMAQLLNVGIGTVLTQLRADDNIFGVRQVILNSRITDDTIWYTTTALEREIHIGDYLAYFMSWGGGDEVVYPRREDMMLKTTLTATESERALKDGSTIKGYTMSRRRYYMPWEEKTNHTKAKPKFADIMKLM